MNMKLLMSSEITSILGQQVYSLFKENCLTCLKDCPRSLESAWELKIVKRIWINPSHNSWCHRFFELLPGWPCLLLRPKWPWAPILTSDCPQREGPSPHQFAGGHLMAPSVAWALTAEVLLYPHSMWTEQVHNRNVIHQFNYSCRSRCAA